MNKDTMTLRSIQAGTSLIPTSVLFLVLSEPRWTELLWAACGLTVVLMAFTLAQRATRGIAFLHPNHESRR